MANDSVQPHASGSLERLLAQRDFVVAVARAVLADAALAEDVAQQTLLTAWSARIDASRQWLATVARRLASNARRSDVRRERRERATWQSDEGPSPQRILELEDERRRLVAAVLELAEPLRTTVLLRFYDDLPPRAIAARQGVPVETIRTRLKRAQELLRERLLPADEATRRERVRGLLVLAGARTIDGVVVATGGAIVATKAWIAAAAVVVAAGLWWWGGGDDVGVRRDLASVDSSTDDRSDGEPTVMEVTLREPEVARSDLTDPRGDEASRSSPTRASSTEVRGRVIDSSGHAIGSAEVSMELDTDGSLRARHRVRADGTFSIPVTNPTGDDFARMEVRAPGFRGLGRSAMVSAGVDVVVGDLVLESGASLRGRVIDDAGSPVCGAWIRATTTRERAAWSSPWSTAAVDGVAEATSAADGTFAFDELRFEWYDLVAGSDAHEPIRVDRVATSRQRGQDVTLVLHQASRPLWIEGVVLDENGVGLAFAAIGHSVGSGEGSFSTFLHSGPDGTFRVMACAPQAVGVASASELHHEFTLRWEDGRRVRAAVDGSQHGRVVLQLPPAKPCSVVFVDAAAGSPIRALANLVIEGAEDVRYVAVESDDFGVARIAAPPSSFSIVAQVEGFATTRVGPLQPIDGEPIEIRMEPTGALCGRVEAQGRGLVRAEVTIAMADAVERLESSGFVTERHETTSRTVTASDGSFRASWDSVGLDDRVLVWVRCHGYADRTIGPTTRRVLDAGGILVVELDGGGAIEGTVTSSDGSSVAGVHVLANRGDGREYEIGRRHARALVAEDGTYRIDRLEPGPWRVEPRFGVADLTSFNRTDRAIPPPNAVVVSGATTRVDLVGTRAPKVSVQGAMTVDGIPRSGLQLELYEAHDVAEPLARDFGWRRGAIDLVHAAPDGTFELRAHRPGRHVLFAFLPDATQESCLTRVVDLAVGTTFTRFDVTTGRLEGKLDPPREARIDVELRVDAQTVARAIAIAGPDGRWSTGPVVAGRSTVVVDGEFLATVDVVPGKVTTVGGE
ncbi:MAG: sigma-70 family RNA polymerase sigma factor [Planctomycetes bacterium]|nr:sigma-70 family RNA polymerase sigma factor [Planctomycetota bacterium]